MAFDGNELNKAIGGTILQVWQLQKQVEELQEENARLNVELRKFVNLTPVREAEPEPEKVKE